MKSSTKITVRLLDEDRKAIEESLNEFGCRSISDFLRRAAQEKLERFSVGQIVEASISEQAILNRGVMKVITIFTDRNTINDKTIELIGENLQKIADGFAVSADTNHDHT